MPDGSILRRDCWCQAHSKHACPVHTLWPFLEQFDIGQQPFKGIGAQGAMLELRSALALLGHADAAEYRTHDLRRGHTQDLIDSGATLAKILAYGQWRSPGFMKYVNIEQLERKAVVAAHVDESSDEEE